MSCLSEWHDALMRWTRFFLWFLIAGFLALVGYAGWVEPRRVAVVRHDL